MECQSYCITWNSILPYPIIFKRWKYNHYFIILVVLFESSIQQSLKTKDYKEHPSHSMYLKLKNHLKKKQADLLGLSSSLLWLQQGRILLHIFLLQNDRLISSVIYFFFFLFLLLFKFLFFLLLLLFLYSLITLRKQEHTDLAEMLSPDIITWCGSLSRGTMNEINKLQHTFHELKRGKLLQI